MREEKENFVARTTAKYLGLLGDPNPAARRGYTAALGCLPLPLLRPRIDAVIEALLGATRPEENPGAWFLGGGDVWLLFSLSVLDLLLGAGAG